MHVDLPTEFAALWESSTTPPDVFAYLQQHSAALSSEKLNVLLFDQQRRWHTNCPLRVEDYLARLAGLAADPDLKLQLAVGEFQARRCGETTPGIDEFTSRFSDLGDSLKEKLLELVSRGHENTPDPFGTTTLKSNAIECRRIGRYRLVRPLGQGAFGQVWLGFDEELQRQVAIKVPSPERFQRPNDAAVFLAEARTLAKLDHPHIVPVHDMGRTDDGMVFVVSKFIEGCNLAERIKRDELTYAETATLLATIADALESAHQKRLVHRDIKPANILIEESSGKPYVADFGLAVSEDDFLHDSSLAGTPGYMSPEQARGEGHRLDARSDIFSLGVVLYELLTGKRPFRGHTPNELLHQVITVEPVPPRELDVSIPSELERICIKALSKQASDRYSTAAQLADDLSHWQQGLQQATKELKIVPRGLRSFDTDDADFFLELLPGPRNRDGLPESIQFWKTRIEETDPDQTFNVGLVYGPSGCGKSSLVKAGLLPRLSKDVIAVYVEATPEETEIRILRSMRKRVPNLPSDLGLVATFAALRRREGQKVVVVLDQFEQWLHAHRAEQDTELVGALRQCDGGKVQAVVMVRDDFAMAASRFMDSLDIPIVQGQNFDTVDLFDIDHAQKVLTKFGQAFGKLPVPVSGLSNDEKTFLSRVATGLAQDGKVVSVRLALFAEMVKGKPWLSATLEQVGGTEGIGVNFLDETFSSRTANPQHRLRQQAARAVLKALLPEGGTDIKGQMHSHAELLAASGSQNRPQDFNDLLRILDGELRLITPTDPEGFQSDSGSDPGAKYYQLTHDYLVPSLREWLTRKQRETRRGRAELLLADRAAMWNGKPEDRLLPSVLEHVRIRTLARRQHWTDGQKKLMRRASRVHLQRGAILLLVLAVLSFAGLSIRSRILQQQDLQQAKGLVAALLKADVGQVPNIVRETGLYRQWADPLLRAAYDEHSTDSPERLRASLALLPVDPSQVEYLRRRLLTSDPATLPVIRDALTDFREQLLPPLWKALTDDKTPTGERFNAACALATYDPGESGSAAASWKNASPFVADRLVALLIHDPSHYALVLDAMQPVRGHLFAPLGVIFRDPGRGDSERSMVTSVLTRYAAGDTPQLAALTMDAEPNQFGVLYPVLAKDGKSAAALLQKELARKLTDDPNDPQNEALAKRQANAAAALARLGAAEQVWPLFKHPGNAEHFGDPRVRSYLVDRLGPLGCDPQVIVARLDDEPDVSARRALILALGSLGADKLPETSRGPLVEKLAGLYRDHSDPGIHGACEWLLHRWGQGERLRNIDDELQGKLAEKKLWYVNGQGQTLTIIRGPVEFTIGSPPSETDREGGPQGKQEHQHHKSINRTFAIATHEVTLAEFLRFRKDHIYTAQYVSPDGKLDLRCPATRVTWYDAAAYCNWLSEQEKIDKDQWCYEPKVDGKEEKFAAGMKPADEYLHRSGYRLPTEVEWEFACRALSSTSRYYGQTVDLLPHYAWYAKNSRDRWLLPVGSLLPNDLGLFDIQGNALEWCQEIWSVSYGDGADLEFRDGSVDNDSPRILRGGSLIDLPAYVRSAYRSRHLPSLRYLTNGFRPARTYP